MDSTNVRAEVAAAVSPISVAKAYTSMLCSTDRLPASAPLLSNGRALKPLKMSSHSCRLIASRMADARAVHCAAVAVGRDAQVAPYGCSGPVGRMWAGGT